MTRRIFVEGQDGSAKTPFCEALVSLLQSRHASVAYCAPFTLVNAALGTDVYHLWPRHYARAARLLLEQILKPTADIVVYDRGALTVERGLDEVENLPLEMREAILTPFPVGEHIFLDTSLENAQSGKRINKQKPPWSLEIDQRRRRELSKKYTPVYSTFVTRESDVRILAAECVEALQL